MIAGLCLLIALICVFGIIKAMMTGKPPGQQGISGTKLENSKNLKDIQVVLLTVMLVFSMMGFIYFFKMGQ